MICLSYLRPSVSRAAQLAVGLFLFRDVLSISAMAALLRYARHKYPELFDPEAALRSVMEHAEEVTGVRLA